ncbi:hypothetical protein SK128_024168, partial [Halocaridina rubra]
MTAGKLHLDRDVHEVHSSGFPSKRINLSPFTKDFRGGEQLNESITHFLLEAYFSRPNKNEIKIYYTDCTSNTKKYIK